MGMTDAAKDADILTDLTAISRYLDAKLGRSFGRDTSAVPRIYFPVKKSNILIVDDMSAPPTGVAIDTGNNGQYATALLAMDYELHPLNANLQPEPRPWTSIALVPWGSVGMFELGVRVRVTAQYGWPSVPLAIRQATINLTALLRLETQRATRRVSELSEMVEISPQAQRIVTQLADAYGLARYA